MQTDNNKQKAGSLRFVKHGSTCDDIQFELKIYDKRYAIIDKYQRDTNLLNALWFVKCVIQQRAKTYKFEAFIRAGDK